MKEQSYFILGMIFTFIIAIMAVFNADPVKFNYLFGSKEWPLIFIILVSALLGGIVTFLLNLRKIIRLKNETKELKQQLALNEKILDAKPLTENEKD